MKRTLLILLFLSITLVSNAQKDKLDNKWYSTAEIEFIFPYKYHYSYFVGNKIIFNNFDNIFSLKSFGAQYTYNYTFFSKLSVGALAGIQTLSEPSNFFMIKVGGILKYFFAGRDNIFIYTQMAHVFSTNKSQFKKGGNGRLGIGLPILKRDGFNITTNVFVEHNSLDLDGAKPIYGIEDEVPSRVVSNSFGISFGVQF